MKQLSNKYYLNNAQQNRNSVLKVIAVYIKAVQVKCAKYLQLKVERFTKRKKKLLLLLFCLLFGGCSIMVMLYSFITINTPVQTSQITLPEYATVHRLKPRITDSLITQEEYERISHFKRFLKQLQEDASGKKIYDSLVQARPFLLDSIHQVDSIYLNQ